jgi:hemoglobin
MEFGIKDNSYITAGGKPGLEFLVSQFYQQMDILEQAQKIRHMHPTDLSESEDKLVCFLSGWLGGPKLYKEKYGSISIPRTHQHLLISETEKDAWLLCMQKALEQTSYSSAFKQYLLTQLTQPASRCVNT